MCFLDSAKGSRIYTVLIFFWDIRNPSFNSEHPILLRDMACQVLESCCALLQRLEYELAGLIQRSTRNDLVGKSHPSFHIWCDSSSESRVDLYQQRFHLSNC